nr:hypothetical protein [Tanacetum cinerariifolium]GFC61623.1 hypothetical protein [Tanacetum cinerariifolium]
MLRCLNGGLSNAELKSHTYYEHRNYESFTCWRVFTNDAVEESSSSWMVAAKANSKAHTVKRLNKGPSVTTPSKEELEDSDAEESFVAESQPKAEDVGCSSDTRKKK